MAALSPASVAPVYNLSRALARQGVPTLYLNPLSKDRFGRQLADGLHADGVHLATPEPVQAVTSLAVVAVDAQGHPDYAFYREGVADRATSAAALDHACAQEPGSAGGVQRRAGLGAGRRSDLPALAGDPAPARARGGASTPTCGPR